MIGAHAGQHRIVAGAGDDGVAPGRLVQRIGGLRHPHRGRTAPKVELRVVAGDDVVAVSNRDVVGARAAGDEVVAVHAENRIVAADQRIDRLEQVGYARRAVREVAGTAAAEGFDDGRRRQAGQRVARIADHAAAVAEEDVVTRTAGDAVVALATEDDQRQRGFERAAQAGIAAGGDDRVGVAERRVIVPRTLRIQDDHAVGLVRAGGRGVEIHIDRVVAQPGVQRRDGTHARPHAGAVDPDRVVAEAAPDRHAVGEAAGRIGAIGNRALRGVVPAEGIVAAGQAADRHLGRGRLEACGLVGDHDVAVVQRTGFVAHHQQRAPGSGIDVQAAGEVVQVAGQESGSRIEADVRGRGNVDAVVAVAQRDVGRRRRATDIQHVVALAQHEVQVLDFVVVDSVDSCLDGSRTRLDVGGAGAAIHGEGRREYIAGNVFDSQHRTITPGVEFGPTLEVDEFGQGTGDGGVRLVGADEMAEGQRTAAAARQRDTPGLARQRPSGGGDARRRGESGTVAADDHQHRTFGERGVACCRATVDGRRQRGCDGSEAVVEQNRVAVRGGGHHAVAEHDAPDLARRWRAREDQRRFGRGRAIDGFHTDGSTRHCQARLEGAAVAVDDHHDTAIGRRREDICRAGVDDRRETDGDGVRTVSAGDRQGVGAGDSAQGDGKRPGPGRARQAVEVHRRGTRRVGGGFEESGGSTQRDRRVAGLVLDGTGLLGLEQAGVDVVNRQIAMRSLEGDDEGIADLAHREVVGVRPGRDARREVECRIDVERCAVRVEDRAQGLEYVEGRRVAGDLAGLEQLEFPALVLDPEPQREVAAGHVRVDGDGLNVVDACVNRRTVAKRRGANLHRCFRAGQQTGGLGILGPGDLLLVLAGLVEYEGDGVGHVARIAHFADNQVVEAVKGTQPVLHLCAVQRVIEDDVGMALGAGDGAGIDFGDEDATLPVDDQDAGSVGDGGVARRTGVHVELRGEAAGKLGQRLRRGADQDRVLEAADPKLPGLAGRRRADQVDHRGGCRAAVDRGLCDRDQRQGCGHAAAGDVQQQQAAARRDGGRQAVEGRAGRKRRGIDLRREGRGYRIPRLAGRHAVIEFLRGVADLQRQRPVCAAERHAAGQAQVDRRHEFLARAVGAGHDGNRTGRDDLRRNRARRREIDAEPAGDKEPGTVGQRGESGTEILVDGGGETCRDLRQHGGGRRRRRDHMTVAAGDATEVQGDVPGLADIRRTGQRQHPRLGRIDQDCRADARAVGASDLEAGRKGAPGRIDDVDLVGRSGEIERHRRKSGVGIQVDRPGKRRGDVGDVVAHKNRVAVGERARGGRHRHVPGFAGDHRAGGRKAQSADGRRRGVKCDGGKRRDLEGRRGDGRTVRTCYDESRTVGDRRIAAGVLGIDPGGQRGDDLRPGLKQQRIAGLLHHGTEACRTDRNRPGFALDRRRAGGERHGRGGGRGKRVARGYEGGRAEDAGPRHDDHDSAFGRRDEVVAAGDRVEVRSIDARGQAGRDRGSRLDGHRGGVDRIAVGRAADRHAPGLADPGAAAEREPCRRGGDHFPAGGAGRGGHRRDRICDIGAARREPADDEGVPGDRSRVQAAGIDARSQLRGDAGQGYGIAHHVADRLAAQGHGHGFAAARRAAEGDRATVDADRCARPADAHRHREARCAEDDDGFAARGRIDGAGGDRLCQCRHHLGQGLRRPAGRDGNGMVVVHATDGHAPHLAGHGHARRDTRTGCGRQGRVGGGDATQDMGGGIDAATQVGACGRHGDLVAADRGREAGQGIDLRCEGGRQVAGATGRGHHLDRLGHAADHQGHRPDVIGEHRACHRQRAGRSRRRRNRQRIRRRHIQLGGEGGAGQVDHNQHAAVCNREEVLRRLGVDCRGQASRHVGEGL